MGLTVNLYEGDEKGDMNIAFISMTNNVITKKNTPQQNLNFYPKVLIILR